MDNSQQQAPVQSPPPVERTTNTEMVYPSDKKRTGKIVGIVLGSIFLLALIAGVLLYFLWWQNPKKMVTDAVVNLINTEQMMASGKMSMKSPSMAMTMEIKQNTTKSDSNADVVVRVKPKGLEKELSLNLSGVYTDSGDVYVKVDGLNSTVDTAIDSYISSMEKSNFQTLTLEQRAHVKGEFRKIADPIVSKADKKWLKISASDFKDNKQLTCTMDVFKELQTNKEYKKEIADAYRDNDFLVIKDSVDSKNGAKGFEIDLDSQEVRDKAKSFGEALKGSSLAKRLKDCDKSSQVDVDDRIDKASDSDTRGTLRVWVDPWSHQLRSVEVKAGSEKDKSDMELVYDLDPGKSKEVEIPSGAENFKSVMDDIQKSFVSQFGSTPSRSSAGGEVGSGSI